MSERQKWLNGWPQVGNSVLIGSGVHCAACGRSYGITCIAIPLDYITPEKLPDWPFNEETCPVCANLEDKLEKAWPRGKRRPLP